MAWEARDWDDGWDVRRRYAEEYRAPATVARLAKGWLAIAILTSIFAGVAEADQYALLSDESFTIDIDEATASDARLALAYTLSLCALVLCAGFFIAWTRRVYKNATALGAEGQRFAPGWAIGGWFVPILAWWRPKQIVNDVWRTSDPEAPAPLPRGRWEGTPVPAFITAWWLVWIASGIADRVSANYTGDAATLEQLRVSSMLGILASGLTVIAGLLAIRVVTVLTYRQERRAERLSDSPSPPAAEPT